MQEVYTNYWKETSEGLELSRGVSVELGTWKNK